MRETLSLNKLCNHRQSYHPNQTTILK